MSSLTDWFFAGDWLHRRYTYPEIWRQGAEGKAIALTGKPDGFLKNEAIKIKMPDKLRPVEKGLRMIGQGAQVDELALEFALHTEQLVFGPAFAAQRYLRRRELVEVRVRGWAVRDQLHLSCNADRVRARVHSTMIRVIRAALAGLERE